jgi:adenylate cyclase
MPDNTNPEAWPLPDLHRARRAIVVVDVVESVRLMQEDEAGFIERWRRFVHAVRTEVLPKFGGRLVKSLGDGMLLTFETAPSSLAAAFACNALVNTQCADLPAHKRLSLRLGISVGDVADDDLDVYGQEVNLAARLSTIGGSGEIIVSHGVADELVDRLDGQLEDLGPSYLKHMQQPVHVFRVSASNGHAAPHGPDTSASTQALPAFAALTFSVPSGSAEERLLGEIVADQLSAALSRSRDLRVISRLSCRSLAGRAVSVPDAGRLLGAQYILSGAIRKIGPSTVSIWYELAETVGAQVIASRTVAGSVLDICDPHSDCLSSVTQELAASIIDREVVHARTASLVSLPGHSLFLAAMVLMHRTSRIEFDRSRDMLEHLAQREPRHAAAHAWLAKWHILRVVQGWSVDADVDARQALTCVRRSLDVNDQSALAWSIHGLVHGYLYKDLGRAEASYQQALDFEPNEPLAWLFTSTLRAYRGDGPGALDSSANAMGLSPLDPIRYFFESLSATASLAGGHWSRSIELARSSLRLNRSHASTWRTLVFALDAAGQPEEARKAAAGLLGVEPRLTVEKFRARFPGRDGPLAQPWAEALQRAGVPAR